MKALAAALVLVAGSATAQTVAGGVETLVQTGFQTPEAGGRAQVASGDAVFRRATLETETGSWIVTRFRDETTLTVAPSARVKIDDYVYDGGRDGRFDLALVSGALRFTSGRIRKSGYAIFTPVAYIGVRGTDFSVATVGADAIDIWVTEGVVEVSPRDNPLPVTLAAPAYARCDAAGCETGAAPAPAPTTPPGGGPAPFAGDPDADAPGDDPNGRSQK